MTVVCRACLVVSPDPFTVVAEDDYEGLRALLDGEFAAGRCPGCGLDLDAEPTVIVVFREAATTLYVAPAELARERLGRYLTPGAAPHLVRCPDQQRLREQVRHRLVPRLAPVRRLLTAAGRGEQAHPLADCWADFPPPVVVAAGLAATCPGDPLVLDVSGERAGHGLDPLLAPHAHGHDVVERALTRLQIGVWQALVVDWSTGNRTGLFAADLDRYVSAAAIPAAGVGLVPEIFADQQGDTYLLAALQAAVARAAGLPNPHAPTWAVLYFAFEIALRRQPSLAARAVSPGFAAATIDHGAAWIAVRESLALLRDLPTAEAATIVQAIAEAAGHPGVPAAVLQEDAVSPHGPATSARELVDRALPLGSDTPVAVATAGADVELRSLSTGDRAALLDDVAELLLRALAPDEDAALRVWWAANRLKLGQLDHADEVLRGLRPDAPMDDATHARFLGARADVLTGRGRSDDATALWRRAETFAIRAGDLRLRYWIRVNLAIRLQETDPDRALEILEDAAWGPDCYGGDHAIFGLLASLRHRRGDTRAAVELLAEAERLSNGDTAARYAAQRRLILTSAGGSAPPRTGQGDDPTSAGRALRAGNRAEFLRLAHDRAVALHNARDPAAAKVWEQLVRLRDEYGFAADPQELAEAARGRLAAGDPEEMRTLLSRLPAALVRRFGNAPDNIEEPRNLLRPLVETAEMLTRAARDSAVDGLRLGGTPADDLRLVGELQRDAIGRALAARRGDSDVEREEPSWFGAPDPAIATTGPVAVVEWIQTADQRLSCLLTRVDADGSRAWWLTQASNPEPVRDRLLARLDAWRSGREGDPLDEPGWRTVSDHLVEQLATHLADGDHVVFLHHQVVANLPWHAAIRHRWTVSYAAGWTHLAGIAHRPPAARETLGLCLVPRAGEDAQTLRALSTAHDRLAALDGVQVSTGEPTANDAGRLARLLSDEDAVVLLCHGYHVDESQDVGFLLAADGALPPADTVLSRRPGHRFGRRDAARLPRTAPVVFTPACSTARGYGAGLGDRLGLAAALRRGGTTAMVAPTWDVSASSTTPVLTAVVERFLRGEPLAQALRSAATAAAASVPAWLAWSLALEGDWR